MTSAEIAQHFRDMAEQIERNPAGAFGGAYVIIPPATDTDPMSVLVLDNKQDAAGFFNLLQWRVKMKLDEIEQDNRRAQAYGR